MNANATAREPQNARQARRKRMALRMNAWLAVLLSTVLLVMVNALAWRHPLRRDVSRERFFALTAETRAFLATLHEPLEVVVFLRHDHPYAETLTQLLKEYRAACPVLRLRWIDPDRDPALADEGITRFNVTEPETLVVATGGRVRRVALRDFFDIDYEPLLRGEGPRALAFRGEEALSSALLSVRQEQQPVVYFLSGHGERALNSFDPQHGYSGLARRLRYEGIEARPLLFGETARVPSDAAALVIAGPRRQLPEPVVNRIAEYLEGNGRVVVAADAGPLTGLEPLLETWGVRLRAERVFDPARSLSGREIFVADYGEHPVTGRLQGQTSLFYQPRPVEPVSATQPGFNPADRPRATALAWTSDSAYARPVHEDPAAAYDPARDRQGPIPLAAAIERGPVPSLGVRISPARLVVFGDAQFVANGAQTGSGMEFFMAGLNWLLERRVGVELPARPIRQARLVLTRRQRQRIFLSAVAGWPAMAVLIGGLVWWRRRT